MEVFNVWIKHHKDKVEDGTLGCTISPKCFAHSQIEVRNPPLSFEEFSFITSRDVDGR